MEFPAATWRQKTASAALPHAGIGAAWPTSHPGGRLAEAGERACRLATRRSVGDTGGQVSPGQGFWPEMLFTSSVGQTSELEGPGLLKATVGLVLPGRGTTPVASGRLRLADVSPIVSGAILLADVSPIPSGTFRLPDVVTPGGNNLTGLSWFVPLIPAIGEYPVLSPVLGRDFGSMTEAQSNWFTVPFLGAAVTVRGHLAGLCAPPTAMSWGDQAPKAKDDASLRDDFASAFRTDPEGAVDQFVKRVEGQPGGGLAAAKVFLPYLVRASYAQQNLFLDAVLRTSTPDEVLCAALMLSEGSAGEAVLEVAAGVLEHFGERSWPALANLVASKDSRCRHFVRAVGYIPSPAPQAKIDALVALATNPDLDTRWLAEAVAEDVSPEAAEIVWRTLCADPDEQLRTTAEAQIASLIV